MTNATDSSALVQPTVLKGRHGDPQSRLNQLVLKLLADRPRARVLEAGCGSSTRITLPPDRYLVGIDIEQRQLDKNAALDEKYLADLQTFPLPQEGFDLILCWDVIEHLPAPIKALERMTAALKPGGSLILAYPNLWSLKGLVTKFTPYKIHEWFYRHVIGDKRPSNEWDQFGTTLHFSIAPPAIRKWADRNGLSIIYDEVYEGPVQCYMRSTKWYMNAGFGALGVISRVLTLGRVDLGLSDCVMVLRRPA